MGGWWRMGFDPIVIQKKNFTTNLLKMILKKQ